MPFTQPNWRCAPWVTLNCFSAPPPLGGRTRICTMRVSLDSPSHRPIKNLVGWIRDETRRRIVPKQPTKLNNLSTPSPQYPYIK